MRRGLFVTGTDTGVGKTVVSAALLRRYGREAALRYWKPIQTGAPPDDDTAEVRRLADGAGAEVVDGGVRLPDPVSSRTWPPRAQGQRSIWTRWWPPPRASPTRAGLSKARAACSCRSTASR